MILGVEWGHLRPDQSSAVQTFQESDRRSGKRIVADADAGGAEVQMLILEFRSSSSVNSRVVGWLYWEDADGDLHIGMLANCV